MSDLIYIGDGAWLTGVPTRDLTADDIEACGRSVEELIGSGLYRTETITPTFPKAEKIASDNRTKRSKA